MQLEHLSMTCGDTEAIDCPLCGSRHHTPLLTEQSLVIVRCRRCRLVFVNPQPTARQLRRFYAQYFPPESAPLWAKQMGQVFRREGREYLLRRKKHGRLLDVGCGFGFFLKMMRDAGWDVVGVEPSPTAAASARRRFGLNVLAGRLEDASFPPESFDAITLWYVLEHVPNPMDTLARCSALLKPGGALIVRVPNNNAMIDAVLARLGRFGQRFFLIRPPRHLFDYTLDTLTQLLARNRLRVVCAGNSIPRSTGTIPQLLRRSAWFFMAECIRILCGERVLLGSSITVYAAKWKPVANDGPERI